MNKLTVRVYGLEDGSNDNGNGEEEQQWHLINTTLNQAQSCPKDWEHLTVTLERPGLRSG